MPIIITIQVYIKVYGLKGSSIHKEYKVTMKQINKLTTNS